MNSALVKKKMAATKKLSERQVKPRKRAMPLWKRTWFQAVCVSVMLAVASGSGWWLHQNGTLSAMLETTKWQAIAASKKAGLKINEVLVVGRHKTKADDLLTALGISRGAAILAFDVSLAKKRVEDLPWVRRASVERMLPDTVLLTVEERKPLALWQHNGTFALIDYEGEVILDKNLDDYRDLMVVVGEDAPKFTADLLETLGSQPELLTLVEAAVRVGGRRWNLRLSGDIDVQLPEEGTTTAWLRLAQYQRSHGVLERDVKIVDLRLPDRLIVRKGNSLTTTTSLGQET